MENPYHPFATPPAPLLARRTLAAKLLETLPRNNVSVVGRPHYGKSVLLAHLAAEAKKSNAFTDVVLWDLRHFIPEEDAAFFQQFGKVLAAQLTAFGDDPREFFAKEEDCTAASIGDFLNWLQGNNHRVLLVMDGLDGPLSCAGLSKNVWDNLCAFADKNSLRFLAGSRRRLRELCQNPESRTSDFFRRFDDPPTSLNAFNEAECREYIDTLESQPGLVKGADSEFRRQTGGVPLLCAALARILHNEAAPITVERVRAAAEELLAVGSETIPEAWNAADVDEQAAYAELAQAGELRPGANKLADALVRLGFADRTGSKISITCELVRRYSESQHGSLRSVRTLFEAPSDYTRNIAEVVVWRFKQITVKDETLRNFIERALTDMSAPKVCLAQMRGIAKHALDLVWLSEAPNREIPKFKSSFGLEFINKHGPKLPADYNQRLRCLDLLTDERNGAEPERANRRIYCLLQALKELGDFGQHPDLGSIPPNFAALACLTAVELAAELSASGLILTES